MSKRKSALDSKLKSATSKSNKAKIESELPSVDSPSIVPGEESPQPVTAVESEAQAPAAPVQSAPSMSPRKKRSAALAASVIFASAFGAVVGAAANVYFAPAARIDASALSERAAMQQSIAQLSKEITAVKADSEDAVTQAQKEIAILKTNLNAAAKTTATQLAKLGDRIAHMEQEAKAAQAADVTGSISKRSATTKVDAVPADPNVVQGWMVRVTRNGLVYVQGHNGIYRVVPGTKVPELGTVKTIKQKDGHWLVVTSKGDVVSMRTKPD